jgi:tetratricopeptide (TPR) repeat protein
MYETHVYERVNVTYLNGAVDSYEETKPLYDNPLPVAKEGLDKAKELDTDKKLEKKIVEAYLRLADLFERQAIEVFLKEDFKSAFINFEQSVIIGQKPFLADKIDTTTIFNTGMAASRANMDDESIKYYELALSYNYPEPTLYIFLKNKYFAKEDTAKGVELLGEGFDKFPDNQDIVVELINYYLLSGKGEEALNYIKIAQEKDPDNVSLVFAEGTLYDKQGEIEKAAATYKRCNEIEPEYYNAYYNLGVLYYNNAQKLYDASNDAPDDEYKKMIEQGDDELRKAIPLMEKCYELNPEDSSPLETLKNIYYRLKMTDEYEEVKAKLES